MLFDDRIKESCHAVGTGNISLLGAVASFLAYSSAFNNTGCFYTIIDPITNDFEIGLGTYNTSPNTITRNTVYKSSNSNALVAFTGTGQIVFCDIPKEAYATTGTANKIPIALGSGKLDSSWLPPDAGNVVGPSPSTTDAVAAYADTTGLLLRNTQVIIHSGANDKLEHLASFGSLPTISYASTTTFDLDNADAFVETLTGNVILATTNESVGQRLVLFLKQDSSGGHSITWFSNITWANNVAPATATAINGWNLVELLCTGHDGYGVAIWIELSRRASTLAGSIFHTNGASELVQLDGSSKLPAVDGSQLTNIGITSLYSYQDATGTTNTNNNTVLAFSGLTYTIPANLFTVGKKLKYRITGTWDANSTTSVLNINITIGGSQVYTANSYSYTTGQTGNFIIEGEIVCSVTGASGHLQVSTCQACDRTSNTQPLSLGVFNLTLDTTSTLVVNAYSQSILASIVTVNTFHIDG